MSRSFPVCLLALASVTATLAGCGGTGVVLFDAENGGPKGPKGTRSKVFEIECVDSFKATGGRSALGGAAGDYAVGCTYEGKPMPWSSLGVFHAAPMAAGNWDKYKVKVIEKASGRGCPGVAVRTKPPTENQQGEAIGAWCVDL